ncbi:MAG: hypothetical protein MJZ78_04070 [Bacteroidales bacterium]|nr:hypothetical protein [Bacteroidales bacterium]
MTEQNALSIVSKETLTPAALSMAVREAGITTVRRSIESGFPSIGSIVRQLGYKETAALMVAHIARLETMLNVSRPMQPEAMAETAKTVIDTCLESGININAADIEIVFKRAKQGAYGAFYGGIGCADILGWFNSYISEKSEEYVRYNIEKSRQYDSNTPRLAELAKEKEMELHREAVRHYTEQINKNKHQ